MLAGPPVFPDHLPDGYQFLEEEFSYDPARHLQLEFPERVWTLEEFGYDQAAIDNCASPIAVTTPFRLLSDEGVEILHRVATRLKGLSTSLSGARTPSHPRRRNPPCLAQSFYPKRCAA